MSLFEKLKQLKGKDVIVIFNGKESKCKLERIYEDNESFSVLCEDKYQNLGTSTVYHIVNVIKIEENKIYVH